MTQLKRSVRYLIAFGPSCLNMMGDRLSALAFLDCFPDFVLDDDVMIVLSHSSCVWSELSIKHFDIFLGL